METEIERLNKMRERILNKSKENPTDYSELPKVEKTTQPMTFIVQPDEVELLNHWKENIKGVYGKYGDFEYRFKSTGGFGYEVWVYSELAKITLDLTDVEKW